MIKRSYGLILCTFSHFLLEKIPDLLADIVGFIFLIVGLEEPELVLVSDSKSDQRSQQCVLHTAFQLPSALILAK